MGGGELVLGHRARPHAVALLDLVLVGDRLAASLRAMVCRPTAWARIQRRGRRRQARGAGAVAGVEVGDQVRASSASAAGGRRARLARAPASSGGP